MSLNKTLIDRLYDSIIKTDTCWVWARPPVKSGYGQFKYQYKTYRAHRIVYETLVGPIAPGMTIDHLCRNKLCVNPSHLEQVTSRENTMRADDAPATINANKTHCLQGHKFTEANTYHPPKRADRRYCIACQRQRNLTRKRG